MKIECFVCSCFEWHMSEVTSAALLQQSDGGRFTLAVAKWKSQLVHLSYCMIVQQIVMIAFEF